MYLESLEGLDEKIDLRIEIGYVKHGIHSLEWKWYIKQCLEKSFSWCKLAWGVIFVFLQSVFFFCAGSHLYQCFQQLSPQALSIACFQKSGLDTHGNNVVILKVLFNFIGTEKMANSLKKNLSALPLCLWCFPSVVENAITQKQNYYYFLAVF